MKIAVAGVGYVGLVTAVTLADIGHNVICLDIDKNKLKMLNEGVSPIYEYGLEELMHKNRERLTFTDDVTRYAEAQVIIIGVGTPEKRTAPPTSVRCSPLRTVWPTIAATKRLWSSNRPCP